MSAPDLWGIDPTCLYGWTPKAGREIVTPAVKDEAGEVKESAVYGKPLPGSPIIWLAPISEALANEVETARKAYRKALARAMRSVAAGGDAEAAQEEALDRIEEAYSDALIRKVLAASVKGFQGLCRPDGAEIRFEGDWAKDCGKIRSAWRVEMFHDIVNETAYFGEVRASFTSPLGSQQG